MTNSIEYDHTLAQAIVDTIREPLLVLDEHLRVIAGSRSFYGVFKVGPKETVGRLLYALGDGQWDIPALRAVLVRIGAEHSIVDGFEVESVFPGIGVRVMLLNARQVFYEHDKRVTILLAIEDITERRLVERQRDQLLVEKDLLLQEMQHRVANSLQIIASILLLKARSVTSDETRECLHDAHKRVLAVAAVQQHLQATIGDGTVELRSYLTQLCTSLASSMIGEGRQIAVDAQIGEGRASSNAAVSIGLIVTELMINALKHAFPADKAGSTITITYAAHGTDWTLTVADNGVGKTQPGVPDSKIGLGTSIVAALSEQLSARVQTISGIGGTAVSISHTDADTIPLAA